MRCEEAGHFGGFNIAGGLAIAAACSRPQAESVSAKVDKLFAQWDRPGSPGCALGVSRNGVPVYEHGYGVANLELRIPITPSSVFGAASISKQFTAMSILLLAGRAQLSLDDEVSKFVPEWVDHEHYVTIRHLLTHTSGIREGSRSSDGHCRATGVSTRMKRWCRCWRVNGVSISRPAASISTTTARTTCLAASSSM